MSENKELMVKDGRSLALTVADGVIQNLPEIIGALQAVYRTHKRTQTFSQIVEANIEVLNINKDNFRFLIQSLTELSKTKDSDEETKNLYREMIRTLHEHFMQTAGMAKGLGDFLDKI